MTYDRCRVNHKTLEVDYIKRTTKRIEQMTKLML